MLESTLEKSICKYIKDYGGRAFKWVCPGCTGVPDRICILPFGRIIFVEMKRPGIKDGRSPRQKKISRLLQSLGCTVWLINNKQEFVDKLEALGYAV